MSSLKAQLVIVLVFLTCTAQEARKPPNKDALCLHFDGVLQEAGTKFVALRGKAISGYSVPLCEGTLKPPGGTRCQVTEKSYHCSLGARTDRAKGKQEFEGLAFRTLACFPRWQTRMVRNDSYWGFFASQDKLRVSVVYERLDSEDAKHPPELWLSVFIRDK